MPTTEIGHFLRQLRIDNSESTFGQAIKLEVSAALISGVEIGSKAPSHDFVETVIEAYSLDEAAADAMRNAADVSRKLHSGNPTDPLGPSTIEILKERIEATNGR